MRSHYCGEVTAAQIDQTVTVCGWVHNRRDHGGVIFMDLRDARGLLQVVVDPDTPDIFAIAEHVRSEYVLQISGRVRMRPEGMINPDLPTGEIEVLAKELVLLNKSDTPPIQHDDNPGEELRLKYRYLDLRRDEMQQRLRLRAQVAKALRNYLDDQGYMEVETPMLTRATPEGARDYLVPSRTHAGSFFALPQSPQLFKQLLMMSGLDRYYQIVKCFRDEDLRADRQPEFTQLDIETSFMSENEIMEHMEALIRSLFKEVMAVDLPDPFPRLDYADAMQRYGSDKPDLRIDLELIEVSDLMTDVEFKVFSGPAKDDNGRVAAMCVPDGSKFTRKELDGYGKYVGRYGAMGLAYIKVNAIAEGRDGLQSPIVKMLTDEALNGVLERTGAKDGDVIFFGADKASVVNDALGALRIKVAEDLGTVKSGWAPLWVVNFPMFEWDDRNNRWAPLHHPFTSPRTDKVAELEEAPGTMISCAYDMVLNGSEIGGGSIRIHDQAMQDSVFTILGIEEEEANEKFGFLLEALRYGCPPHGGIAFGLDRLVTLMAGVESIREVIAFPKTQTAHCPLTNAPGPVPEESLKELSIRVRKPVT